MPRTTPGRIIAVSWSCRTPISPANHNAAIDITEPIEKNAEIVARIVAGSLF